MPPTNEELEKKIDELSEKVRKQSESIIKLEERPEPASTDDVVREIEGKVKGKGMSFWTVLGIAAIAAIAVCYVMVGQVGITKTWYNENIAPALNSFSNTYATKDELNNYVTKGEEGNYALKSDLTGFALKSELPTQPDLSGYVTAEQYDILLARVEAMEGVAEEVVSPSPTGGVSVEIETEFFEYVLLPADTTDEVNVPLRLTLTNNTGEDVTDIKVVVSFTPYYYSTTINWVESEGFPKLGGGITSWMQPYTSTYGLVFVNGWGLSLDAGEVKDIALVLALKVNPALETDVRWTPDASVESFDYD